MPADNEPLPRPDRGSWPETGQRPDFEPNYQALFAESPLGIQVYDANGILLTANRASCELFGVSDPGELVGFNLFGPDHLRPETREALRCGETARSTVPVDFDQVAATWLPGSSRRGTRFIELFISPLHDAGGRLTGYQAQMQDVTEREAVAARLRESELTLRQTMERLDIAMRAANLSWWDWDLSQEVSLFDSASLPGSGTLPGSVRLAQQAGSPDGSPGGEPDSLPIGALSGGPDEAKNSRVLLQGQIHPGDIPELTRLISDNLSGKTQEFEAVHRLRRGAGGQETDGRETGGGQETGGRETGGRETGGRETGGQKTGDGQMIGGGQESGKWVWMLSRGRVTERSEQGRPLRVMGISMDISAQKKAEAELQRERDFARLMLDTIGQGLTITNLDDVYGYVNPAFCRMTGYPQEELLGRRLDDIAYPADLGVLARAREARKRGEASTYEMRFVCADGSLKPVLITGAPYLHDGRVEAKVAVITDLSEQKRLQSILQREEERYRMVADFTYNWEYWLAPNGQYVYVSPACERISGYPRRAFIDDPGLFTRIILPEDRPALLAHLQEEQQSPHSTHFVELRIRTATGEERYILHTSQPIYAPDGTYLGRRGTNEDITSRKQSDAQMLYLGTHDALTGIFNRVYFEAELERLNGGRMYPVSILMADVDGLKQANDHLGHAAGDELIRRAAQVLAMNFRQEDIIARIGGDEFAVLLPQTGEEAANACLARLRERLVSTQPIAAGVKLGLSVGVATCQSGGDLYKLQSLADQRMYEEKARKPKVRYNHI